MANEKKFLIFTAIGFVIGIGLILNGVHFSFRQQVDLSSGDGSSASGVSRGPASTILVSHQQEVPRQTNRGQLNQTKSATALRLNPPLSVHKARAIKEEKGATQFERLLTFKTTKSLQALNRSSEFYLLDGVKALPRAALPEGYKPSERDLAFNEFVITQESAKGGYQVAITTDGKDIVVLSGLISIKVKDQAKLENISKRYDLVPERIFPHLGLGYYRPNLDFFRTFQQLQADPVIQETKVEVIEERMKKL